MILAVFALGALGGFSAAHLHSPFGQSASDPAEAPVALEQTRPAPNPIALDEGPRTVPGSSRLALHRGQNVSLEGVPLRGQPDAPITIVQFSDFQCPFCVRSNDILVRALEDYGEFVQVGFRHYPLEMHQDAPLAHRAAIAAGLQGRFWEMHDRIFENPRRLDRATLIAHAEAIGIDAPRFVLDLDRPDLELVLQRDREEGERLGVSITPTFFINGKILVGAAPYANFRTLIERELAALRDPHDDDSARRARRLAASRIRAMRTAAAIESIGEEEQ